MGFTYDDELQDEEEEEILRNNIVQIDKYGIKYSKELKELDKEIYQRRMKKQAQFVALEAELEYHGEIDEPAS